MTWSYEADPSIVKALSSRKTQELGFWQQRYREAIDQKRNVNDAVNCGFDWSVIDPIHKGIINFHIKPSQSVLDVGCGMGRTSEWFKYYTGVDFVPEFIEEAKKQHPGKTFVLANIAQQNLPFPDKSFDWILGLSFKVVTKPNCTEEEWDHIMSEMKRVAIKGILFLEFANGFPPETSKYEIIYI